MTDLDIMQAIAAVVGGPVITFLVQGIKALLKPKKEIIPVLAILVGMVAAILTGTIYSAFKITGWVEWLRWLALGLVVGLQSIGVWEVTKPTAKPPTNEQP